MFKNIWNWMESKLGPKISETPLAKKKDVILDYIKNEYGPGQLSFVKAVVNRVITEALDDRNSIRSVYENIHNYYQKKPEFRSAFVRVMAFDLYDHLFPYGEKVAPMTAKYNLNSHYREIVDYYQNVKKEAGTDSTDRRVSMMSNFFLYMMMKGKKTINDIDEEDVLDFAKDCKWDNRSYRKMANQIAECEPLMADGECLRIASYFPKLGGRKKEYRSLTPEEEAQIEETIFNSDKLTLFQKAFVMLIWLSGIRGCDVQNLRLSNILWNENKIVFVQIKTGRPAKIPLSAVLGNAIWDYIEKERPQCDDDHLFLQTIRKGKLIQPIDTYTEINRIYEIAGMDMQRGLLGAHMIRHRFATEELRVGVDRSVIADALGHTYPSAVNQYTNISETRLKECSIDISCYPIKSKYFKNIINK